MTTEPRQANATPGRQDRLDKLRQARGIWRDRTDLPDLNSLRGRSS
jgi:hypothetical protein